MTEPQRDEPTGGAALEMARREKLAKLVALGVDPWGQRFDGHSPIKEIRARENEIVVEPATEEGKPPHQHGPQVRAAGRIVLQRRAGKLIFLDIHDWTGRIQVFLGKNQVGERQLGLGPVPRPGRPDRRGRRVEPHQDGRADDLRRRPCTSSAKSLETPPEKHKGLTDPELRQRMRYLDLIHTEGVLGAVPAADEDRAVDPQHAGRRGFRRGRRAHAARHRRRGGRAAVRHAPQRPGHRPVTCASPWSCTSSGCWWAASSGSTSWDASIATKGSTPGTIPSSPCSKLYQAYGDYRSMMDLTEKLIVDGDPGHRARS